MKRKCENCIYCIMPPDKPPVNFRCSNEREYWTQDHPLCVFKNLRHNCSEFVPLIGHKSSVYTTPPKPTFWEKIKKAF